jgi:hypothetical protein
MQKGGPYKEVYPEVLEISKGRFFVDYAYHLAPLDRTHIGEIDSLINDFGVTSFKIFMFYGGYGLHGASSSQHEFLMIGKDEKYDIAHFEFVMRGVQRAMQRYPEKKDSISLSLHCELADILNAYTRMVEGGAKVTDLDTYLTGETHDRSAACAPIAPRVRRIRKASRSRSRPSSRTRRTARTSTCCTSRRARRSSPRCAWRRRSRTSTSVAKSLSRTCASTMTRR